MVRNYYHPKIVCLINLDCLHKKYQRALKHSIGVVSGAGCNLGSWNDKQRWFPDKNVVFIQHNKHQDTIANNETVFLSFCVSYLFVVHILVSVIFLFVDLLPFTTFMYFRFKTQNKKKCKFLYIFFTPTLFCKVILVLVHKLQKIYVEIRCLVI